MEAIIFYILIFMIGTLFGSFFSLAIYRIPLRQDITHERSYCPNCNHKLSFFDMIPILSYLFLGGKCRYCKHKIRIRYVLLEIVTGIVFLLFAMSLNLQFSHLESSKIIYLLAGVLYTAGLIIIAGIDKEKHQISKNVLLYQIIVVTGYIIYLYVVENTNIYRYVMYLFIISMFLLWGNHTLKRTLKNNYVLDILVLSLIMAMFSEEGRYLITVIFTLLSLALDQILLVLHTKKYKRKEQVYYQNLPIGFYLCIANIITILVTNMMACRW